MEILEDVFIPHGEDGVDEVVTRYLFTFTIFYVSLIVLCFSVGIRIFMEAPRGVLDIVEKEKEAAALDGSRDGAAGL